MPTVTPSAKKNPDPDAARKLKRHTKSAASSKVKGKDASSAASASSSGRVDVTDVPDSSSPPRKAPKTGKAAGILKNPAPSSSNKRSSDGTTVEGSTTRSAPLVKRAHQRVYVTCGTQLDATNSKEAQEDFQHQLKEFFTVLQLLDKSCVIEPLNPNDRKYNSISKKSQFPNDMAILSYAYVKVAPYQFKPRMNKSTGDTSPPVVYAVFAISCDEAPETLLSSASFKWTALGGFKMEIKKLQCAQSKVVAHVFSLKTDVSSSTLQDEMKRILAEAYKEMSTSGELSEEFAGFRIPEVSLVLGEPKSLSSNKKDDATYAQKQLRKMYQIEVDMKESEFAAVLIEKATQLGLWGKFWGKWAKVSAPLDKKSATLVAQDRQAEHHTQHQRLNRGTAIKGIDGIQGLDVAVSVPDGEGKTQSSVTLRQLFLHLFKTLDGKSLFASVHQGVGMTEVEAVVPDSEDYHRLTEMMNKNVAAYTYYYLTTMHKMDSNFVLKLLDKTMDPNLVADFKDCEWDKSTFTITTPQEKKDDARDDALANQPWMIDLQQIEADRVNKPSQAAFRLDDRQSLGTMHPQNDEKRKTAVKFGVSFEAPATADDQHDVTSVNSSDDELLPDADDTTGYQPNDDDTSPTSTDCSQNLFPSETEKDKAAMEEAANMV